MEDNNDYIEEDVKNEIWEWDGDADPLDLSPSYDNSVKSNTFTEFSDSPECSGFMNTQIAGEFSELNSSNNIVSMETYLEVSSKLESFASDQSKKSFYKKFKP